MPEITLAQAEAQLQAYVDAETAILGGGQSYTIKDRAFTRADLQVIRDGITYWNGMVRDLTQTSRGRRIKGVTPY